MPLPTELTTPPVTKINFAISYSSAVPKLLVRTDTGEGGKKKCSFSTYLLQIPLSS